MEKMETVRTVIKALISKTSRKAIVNQISKMSCNTIHSKIHISKNKDKNIHKSIQTIIITTTNKVISQVSLS
jgi:hypothetical protein